MSNTRVDVIQETSPMETSQGRDLLIIEWGPMTRSRTKQVNQVMGLFVQSTIDETSIYVRKESLF